MRKRIYIILFAFIVVFIGCNGSGFYRGSWKGIDSIGSKVEIIFDSKTLTIIDSLGGSRKFDYKQRYFMTQNSEEIFGIDLHNGRKYQISFPFPDNENTALIVNEKTYVIYTISRNGFE